MRYRATDRLGTRAAGASPTPTRQSLWTTSDAQPDRRQRSGSWSLTPDHSQRRRAGHRLGERLGAVRDVGRRRRDLVNSAGRRLGHSCRRTGRRWFASRRPTTPGISPRGRSRIEFDGRIDATPRRCRRPEVASPACSGRGSGWRHGLDRGCGPSRTRRRRTTDDWSAPNRALGHHHGRGPTLVRFQAIDNLGNTNDWSIRPRVRPR